MRLLLDEHGLAWDEAWKITREATSYTNHTLMPEALETWPLRMFEELLPRHLEIVYEINHRFLEDTRARFPRRRRAWPARTFADRRKRRAPRAHGLAGGAGLASRERRFGAAFAA
jgi:glucan phosphorylase